MLAYSVRCGIRRDVACCVCVCVCVNTPPQKSNVCQRNTPLQPNEPPPATDRPRPHHLRATHVWCPELREKGQYIQDLATDRAQQHERSSRRTAWIA